MPLAGLQRVVFCTTCSHATFSELVGLELLPSHFICCTGRAALGRGRPEFKTIRTQVRFNNLFGRQDCFTKYARKYRLGDICKHAWKQRQSLVEMTEKPIKFKKHGRSFNEQTRKIKKVGRSLAEISSKFQTPWAEEKSYCVLSSGSFSFISIRYFFIVGGSSLRVFFSA